MIPLVIGTLLSPSFQGEAERTFDHPPDKVWEALNDYRSIPMSGRQCRGTESIESTNGLPAWRENMGPSKRSLRPRKLKNRPASSGVFQILSFR